MIDVWAVLAIVRVALGSNARTALLIWQRKAAVGRHARCVLLGQRVLSETSARERGKVPRGRSSGVIRCVLVSVAAVCAFRSRGLGPGCGQGPLLGRSLSDAPVLDIGCGNVYKDRVTHLELLGAAGPEVKDWDGVNMSWPSIAVVGEDMMIETVRG